MKKLFALSLLMAMPASAAVVVTSPVVVQTYGAEAPLQNGGHARCKNLTGCRTWAAPYNDVVAEYGAVYEGALIDGWSADTAGHPAVQILVVHPIGTKDIPFTGIYSRADDWEGVA